MNRPGWLGVFLFCFCLALELNVNYKLTFYFSVSPRVFNAVMAKGQKVPGLW